MKIEENTWELEYQSAFDEDGTIPVNIVMTTSYPGKYPYEISEDTKDKIVQDYVWKVFIQ